MGVNLFLRIEYILNKVAYFDPKIQVQETKQFRPIPVIQFFIILSHLLLVLSHIPGQIVNLTRIIHLSTI